MKKTIISIIYWGVAPALPRAERPDNAYFVKAWEKKFLIALIDGQGHGKRAANAVGIITETLADNTLDSDDVV
jgi:hypothetical protein